VTGASSGIGEAFADVFAAHGFDLVITARREERLRSVAERIQSRDGVTVHVIPGDLSNPAGVQALVGAIGGRGLAIDALVSNAGYGIPGAYTSAPWERQQALLQVMVTSLAELTHRLLPGMIARRYGRVIHVASLAGLVPAPAGHTLYAASKAFVVRFSEALAHEVRGQGVHVTALCPGFTLSEFHDVTGTRAVVSRMPPWMWMDAATVAREGFEAVERGDDVFVNGRVNRAIAAFVKYTPHRVVTAVGRRAGKLYRKT
jgi:short-subunit dehydrogenase